VVGFGLAISLAIDGAAAGCGLERLFDKERKAMLLSPLLKW